MDRLNIDKSDSESTYFNSLLLLGEMAIKVIASGLLAGVENGRDHSRYIQEYRLVRADGIGEWVQVIDEITTGITSQSIIEPLREEQKELITKTKQDAWQYRAVEKLISCVNIVNSEKKEEMSSNVKLTRWFSLFAGLRNSTRGHGATLSTQYALMCEPLFESIKILLDNFIVFKRQWAFLHRSLSGKYRVVPYTEDVSGFDDLKTAEAVQEQDNYTDGIYIYFDTPRRVDLIHTDLDSRDFFFPNGNFTNKTFETLSYVTNNKNYISNENYLTPATSLPASETQGIGRLDVQGECFGNIPEKQGAYIKRETLEGALYNVLTDDRHPVITLVGRGGIGKTTLALEILHRIAKEGKFDFILWFSARDIDLLSKGPKPVKAHIKTIEEISDEFVKLLGLQYNTDKSSSIDCLAKMMSEKDKEKILFVFDNFETTKSPVDLYNWIDTYIRLPNKVLITSRIRDFKGDFPIEITGMNAAESRELVDETAKELNITHILTGDYINSMIEETYGHPYVMKVLLGEVAKEGRLKKIDRIIASMDNILDALFERTYSGLSPAAQRVFLTLCAWNSPVSQLGLEAVLLRPINERMNVEGAIKELRYSSFIEEKDSGNDADETGLFLFVPLVAAEFGKKKMLTYPYINSIKADCDILHLFGEMKSSNIEKGIKPRIGQLINNIRKKVNSKEQLINEYGQMLEYIASRHVPAWLLLADLYQNYGLTENCIYALNRYIESGVDEQKMIEHAWMRLAKIYETQNDPLKELHALVELSKMPNISFFVISDAANKMNSMLKGALALEQDEKKLIVEQLAKIMEKRISEGDADDCSRLAWLFMHLHRGEDARRIAEKGLSLEHDNIYCQNILAVQADRAK
jgi:energy-coupling factor transporter ATP-binding protein EcfA2